jgi:hypothetical protein
MTEQGLGFHKGYCSQFCVPDPSPSPGACPLGSQCLLNGAINANTCFKNCTTKAECRGSGTATGYDCLPVGGTVNACVESADGTGAIGAPCTGYWDCPGGEFGTCLGFTNGYCSQFCDMTMSQPACPNLTANTCVPNAVNSTFSLCEKNCSSDADCRIADGFTCVQPPMDSNKECIQ